MLESNGGRSNAYTSNDMTVYYEDFAADALETVLDLESDRMRSLRIDDEHADQRARGGEGGAPPPRGQRDHRHHGRGAGHAGLQGPPVPLAGHRLDGGHREHHAARTARTTSAPTTRPTTPSSTWSATSIRRRRWRCWRATTATSRPGPAPAAGGQRRARAARASAAPRSATRPRGRRCCAAGAAAAAQEPGRRRPRRAAGLPRRRRVVPAAPAADPQGRAGHLGGRLLRLADRPGRLLDLRRAVTPA